MDNKNYELSNKEHEELTSDLEFLKERLDLFSKEIEIPSSIYSNNLLHLLDDGDENKDENKSDNVIKLKKNIWKRPLTYAAMFAVVFGLYYMTGINDVPDIADTPMPMLTSNETTGALRSAVPPDGENENNLKSASDYKEIRLVLGEMYEERELSMKKLESSAVSSSASAAPAPASPPSPDNGGMGGMGDGAGDMAESSDVSSTNTQVGGVDEADIVKTDGKNIYVYSKDMETQTSQVAIVEAETMTKVSNIVLENDKALYGGGDMEMYLVEDRLVLLNSAVERAIPIAKEILLKPISDLTGRLFDKYNKVSASGSSPSGFASPRADMEKRIANDSYNFSQVAAAVIYDVSDNTNPKEVRRFEQDGDYISSRVYENVLYLVTSKHSYSDARDDNARIADLVPVVGDSLVGFTNTIEADCISIMPDPYAPSYAVVSAVDIMSDTTPATTKAVLGGANDIYMSEDNIYVTGNSRHSIFSPNSNEIKTDIIKMSVDGLKLEHIASTKVDGYIDNQFSLDEHKGNFRIATTSYRGGTTQNNLYVLDENLKKIGAIEGLAPGERIYSVRYMGDMGYVVTFKEVDPLFAIDLSDPKNPKVLGELKIPGFSEYMHPIDKDTLIGFGINTEVGSTGNVFQNGIKLSMFDVKDPLNPKESNVFYLGNQGTQSEALYNHKAFMYNKNRELIGFPITIQTEISNENVKDEWSRQYKVSFSGYMLIRVDKAKGFEIVASIPSLENGQMPSWHMDEDAIRRAVYIEDKLYTVSQEKIMEYSLETSKKLRETMI